MQEIVVEIARDGKTKITTKGFKGKACKDATKELEAAFGGATKTTDTPEMYEKESVRVKQ
jgi:hypothetical protein